MSSLIIINIFLILFVLKLSQAQINDIHPCQTYDPILSECLISQARKAVKRLKNGLPEMNLPPLDPFFINSVIGSGELDLLKIRITMKNISVTGHSNMVFKNVSFDPNTLSGNILFHIPVLGCSCEYDAIGRMFGIQLESNANFNGEFADINSNIKFSLKIVKHNGTQYYAVDNLSVRSKVKNMHIFNLVSFNPSTQRQVDIIKKFTNENDQLILDIIKPLSNSNMALLYRQMFDSYLRHIPIDAILT